MRVCLMLSGLVRNNSTYLYTKSHILDKYSPDVYCHAWYKNEQERIEDTEELTRRYNPKKILMEPHLNLNNALSEKLYPELKANHVQGKIVDNILGQNQINDGLSQFLSLKRVSELFNWDDYDFIIRCRYDKLQIFKFPDLEKLDKSKFYVAANHLRCYSLHPNWFLERVIIMPNDMKEYCNIFDHLRDKEASEKMYKWSHRYTNWFFCEYAFAYFLEHMNFYNKLVKMDKSDFLVN